MSSGFIKDGKYVPVNSAVSIDSDSYVLSEAEKHLGVEYSYNVTGLKPGIYLCRLNAVFTDVANIDGGACYNYSSFNGKGLGPMWPNNIVHGPFEYPAQFITITADQAKAGVPLKVRIGDDSSVGWYALSFTFIAKRVN